MSYLQEMMDAMPLPEGEPIKGKTYLADGWIYRDIPRCSPEMWDKLLDIIGQSNFVTLTLADYGHSKCGQILISPNGIANLKSWHAPLSGDTHD